MSNAQTVPAEIAPIVPTTYIDAVVDLDLLLPSPINPRKTFDEGKLAELADSVRRVGIMQPLVVRPHKKADHYELIFGERRRRAAKLAELADVPVRICNMSDLEVLVAQSIENDQREDVHPLEEADGYKRLRDEHGMTVDQIVDALGRRRSASHIYQRLALCSLKLAARSLFLANKLSASTALLVARIPDEKLQAKAAKEIAAGPMGQPMPASMAADHVQKHYMLRLELASFDTKSELLVPDAGACTTCAKRTGNQRELFSDIKSADVCTDPACFKTKTTAGWKIATAEAQKKGIKVLSAAESKKVFPYPGNSDHMSYSSDYVSLREKPYEDKKGRTYGQLLGREPEGMVLARDQGGGVHKLFPKKTIKAAVKAAGHDLWKAEREAKSKAADPKAKDRMVKQRQEAEAREAIQAAVVTEIEAKLEKHEPSAAQWTELLGLALYMIMPGPEFFDRRGLEIGGVVDRKSIEKMQPKLAKLPAARLRAMFISAAVLEDSYGDAYEIAARAFGVDVKAIAKRVVAAKKESAVAAKKEAAAPAQPEAKKTKSKGTGGKKR